MASFSKVSKKELGSLKTTWGELNKGSDTGGDKPGFDSGFFNKADSNVYPDKAFPAENGGSDDKRITGVNKGGLPK